MDSTTTWDCLGLHPSLMSTLARLGFHTMTPVQASAIPLFLKMKDVAAEAVTGSGKTLAFALPILHTLLSLETPLQKHEIGAIIVSPTRELATQIGEVIEEFLKDIGHLKKMLFIGGKSVTSDMTTFEEEGAQIIVATPGRLEDLLSGKSKSTMTSKLKQGVKCLEILVLDEADRLLSLGFEQTINGILSFLPKQRRTGLFSATQTKDVEKLIRAGLRNPVLVSVKEKEDETTKISQRTPSTLANFYMICQPDQKFANLIAFLRQPERTTEKFMLFFATCACVEYFSVVLERLLRNSVPIFAIHGKKGKRHRVFEDFRSAKSGLLVCTDVMARGVDIPEVNWVLQFDPPSNAEAFVHRCGRTARIGHDGTALLFLLPNEDAYVEFIAINQKVTLLAQDVPDASELAKNLISQLRDWQRNDRRVFDLANKAFVSFVQAYSKHECKYILRLKDLPFGELAMAYGLLKMPRMPELKTVFVKGFKPDSMRNDGFNQIKYKDKMKEKSRQEKLKTYKETGSWPGSKKSLMGKFDPQQAWSNKVGKKVQKQLRAKKKELIKMKSGFSESVKADKLEAQEDLDELEEDYKILKKIRKGKINKDAFDKEIDLEAMDTDEDVAA